MAKVSFTAFVEPWTKASSEHPNWGMKTAEPHRKKDGETWVTVGRTFRTVKSAYGIEIDFTKFRSGDRVTIEGNEVTEMREANGQKYYDLVVKAEAVALAESNAPAPVVASFDDTVPF